MTGKLDLKGMLSQGHATAQAETAPQPKVAAKTADPELTRVPVGTRMRRDLHRHLKGFGLELEEQLQRRVSIEELLESLVLELQADPKLQARIQARCRDSS